jgi:hypothetical protein
MKIEKFVIRKEEVDRILDQLQVPYELPPSTGPPNWIKAQMAQQWMDDNPHLYPEENDFQTHPPTEVHFQDPIWDD